MKWLIGVPCGLRPVPPRGNEPFGRPCGLDAAPYGLRPVPPRGNEPFGRPRGLIHLAAWLLLAVPAWALSPLESLQTAVDAQVQAGFDRPAEALALLEGRMAGVDAGSPDWRVLLLGRGLVAAGDGRQAEAAAVAAQLAAGIDGRLAAADAALVLAAAADTRSDSTQTMTQALAAHDAYRHECSPPAAAGCDHRSLWRALQLLSRHGAAQGQQSAAREHALAAAELARDTGDSARQAWGLAMAADLSAAMGEMDLALRQSGQAQRLARLDGSPQLQARMKIFESRLLQRRGNNEGSHRASEQGLALARQAHSPRLEAVLLTNLSDSHVKAGRPRAALAAIERALPIVRRHDDRRTERVLLANAGLARIGLGQLAAARATLDEVLAASAASGAAADQAQVLREFADALAGAGDARGALELYHRERQLVADLMVANRESALTTLRARFDRQAQLRQLEQLARDNTLIAAQIDNRAAMQKVWVGGALVLGLAMVLVALLYRRVRQTNRQLARSQAVLRVQSRRDPLTGLGNRRCLFDRAQAGSQGAGFEGTLLLVDIDHFKHVNDGHGHATGDLVLVEVARRLLEAVREGDLVVRWGGEEFLIYAPAIGAAQAQALAKRVLGAVGGEPVVVPDSPQGPQLITVSVGYGSFPLPQRRLPLSLERAINLTDMALYTAKNQGRNRAVGIAEVQADDAGAMRAVEADFDQAWRDGRVLLHRMRGPTRAAEMATAVVPA